MNAKVEQAVTANLASSTIVVVVWSFQEACKTDQSYSRLTSMMDISQGQERITKPLHELDNMSRRIANLVLVGPGNPDLYKLPRSGRDAVDCLTELGLPPFPEPSCHFRLSIFLNPSRLSARLSCLILRLTFLG